MASPSSRAELKEYCLRKLGAPVLEINVDDEQIEDCIDDALQYFRERHFDGIQRVFLKHKITQADVDKFKNSNQIHTTTSGDSWEERNNYIDIPDHILGVERVFSFVSSTIRGDLFGIEYQMFLNDLYAFGSLDILNYYMTKSYLETLDMVLNTGAFMQLRFTKTQSRLYIDYESRNLVKDRYIVLDCYRLIDPNDHTKVYNSFFLKRYVTALIKRQWGQNLIKFNNVQLPGGVQLNGRQLFEDATKELEDIQSAMLTDFELPPNFIVG